MVMISARITTTMNYQGQSSVKQLRMIQSHKDKPNSTNSQVIFGLKKDPSSPQRTKTYSATIPGLKNKKDDNAQTNIVLENFCNRRITKESENYVESENSLKKDNMHEPNSPLNCYKNKNDENFQGSISQIIKTIQEIQNHYANNHYMVKSSRLRYRDMFIEIQQQTSSILNNALNKEISDKGELHSIKASLHNFISDRICEYYNNAKQANKESYKPIFDGLVSELCGAVSSYNKFTKIKVLTPRLNNKLEITLGVHAHPYLTPSKLARIHDSGANVAEDRNESKIQNTYNAFRSHSLNDNRFYSIQNYAKLVNPKKILGNLGQNKVTNKNIGNLSAIGCISGGNSRENSAERGLKDIISTARHEKPEVVGEDKNEICQTARSNFTRFTEKKKANNNLAQTAPTHTTRSNENEKLSGGKLGKMNIQNEYFFENERRKSCFRNQISMYNNNPKNASNDVSQKSKTERMNQTWNVPSLEKSSTNQSNSQKKKKNISKIPVNIHYQNLLKVVKEKNSQHNKPSLMNSSEQPKVVKASPKPKPKLTISNSKRPIEKQKQMVVTRESIEILANADSNIKNKDGMIVCLTSKQEKDLLKQYGDPLDSICESAKIKIQKNVNDFSCNPTITQQTNDKTDGRGNSVVITNFEDNEDEYLMYGQDNEIITVDNLVQHKNLSNFSSYDYKKLKEETCHTELATENNIEVIPRDATFLEKLKKKQGSLTCDIITERQEEGLNTNCNTLCNETPIERTPNLTCENITLGDDNKDFSEDKLEDLSFVSDKSQPNLLQSNQPSPKIEKINESDIQCWTRCSILKQADNDKSEGSILNKSHIQKNVSFVDKPPVHTDLSAQLHVTGPSEVIDNFNLSNRNSNSIKDQIPLKVNLDSNYIEFPKKMVELSPKKLFTPSQREIENKILEDYIKEKEKSPMNSHGQHTSYKRMYSEVVTVNKFPETFIQFYTQNDLFAEYVEIQLKINQELIKIKFKWLQQSENDLTNNQNSDQKTLIIEDFHRDQISIKEIDQIDDIIKNGALRQNEIANFFVEKTDTVFNHKFKKLVKHLTSFIVNNRNSDKNLNGQPIKFGLPDSDIIIDKKLLEHSSKGMTEFDKKIKNKICRNMINGGQSGIKISDFEENFDRESSNCSVGKQLNSSTTNDVINKAHKVLGVNKMGWCQMDKQNGSEKQSVKGRARKSILRGKKDASQLILEKGYLNDIEIIARRQEIFEGKGSSKMVGIAVQHSKGSE